MSTSYMFVHVKCPFFKGEEKNKIRCEGVQEGASCIQQYRKMEQKEKWMGRYCCENYKNCRIYKMLEKKYIDKSGKES